MLLYAALWRVMSFSCGHLRTVTLISMQSRGRRPCFVSLPFSRRLRRAAATAAAAAAAIRIKDVGLLAGYSDRVGSPEMLRTRSPTCTKGGRELQPPPSCTELLRWSSCGAPENAIPASMVAICWSGWRLSARMIKNLGRRRRGGEGNGQDGSCASRDKADVQALRCGSRAWLFSGGVLSVFLSLRGVHGSALPKACVKERRLQGLATDRRSPTPHISLASARDKNSILVACCPGCGAARGRKVMFC